MCVVLHSISGVAFAIMLGRQPLKLKKDVILRNRRAVNVSLLWPHSIGDSKLHAEFRTGLAIFRDGWLQYCDGNHIAL